jgi:hypothetical protein
LDAHSGSVPIFVYTDVDLNAADIHPPPMGAHLFNVQPVVYNEFVELGRTVLVVANVDGVAVTTRMDVMC